MHLPTHSTLAGPFTERCIMSSDCNVRLQSNGKYWQARWSDSGGNFKTKSLGSKDKLTKRQANKLCQRLAAEMMINPASRDKVKAPALKPYLEKYREARPELSDGRRYAYRSTSVHLLEYFAPDLAIDRITRSAAADWRASMAASDLAETSICSYCADARTMFGEAVAQDLIPFNPFDRLKRTAPKPVKSWPHISVEDLERVLDACPDQPWRVIVALCRLAGLRRGEALTTKWSAIDWERRRLAVEDHKRARSGHARRVVPISPRLYEILLEAFEQAEPGSEVVWPYSGWNLHRNLVKFIVRAGLDPWRDPWQVLRRNCETDWAQHYPQHVVCEWIGHDMNVSQAHYLMVGDEMYDRASKDWGSIGANDARKAPGERSGERSGQSI